MNNDHPPASKLRKWLMGNNESTLPGLIHVLKLTTVHFSAYKLTIRHTCNILVQPIIINSPSAYSCKGQGLHKYYMYQHIPLCSEVQSNI